MGVIFFLSSRTGNQLNNAFPFISDFNFGHILAYFILAALIYFALSQTVQSKFMYWWSLGICLIYGITDEVHQAFVPTRFPDIGDLIRDVLGAGAALLLIRYIQNKKGKYHSENTSE